MSENTSGLYSFFKKIMGYEMAFGWEIGIALSLKFLLLCSLWWLFFAGKKQPLDEAIIAEKIYGESQMVDVVQKNQEDCNDIK